MEGVEISEWSIIHATLDNSARMKLPTIEIVMPTIAYSIPVVLTRCATINN
jgi:DNA-binding TFAR19-related protein (PDSD5 family)